MFVVQEKENLEEEIKTAISRLESGTFSCFTGAAIFNKELKRWVIPDKMSTLQEVTALRLKTILKYLLSTNLRHTTIRDVWYGVTTGAWGLYNPKYCPKCKGSQISKQEVDTGRKKKDGSPVTTTELTCKDCGFGYTELKNPYQSLGGDITIMERLIGVEKEDLGIHSGQKGLLYGTRRMSINTVTRGNLDLSTRPSIMFDLAEVNHISNFDKMIVLEKESFIGHLVPIEHSQADFTFLNAIDCAIITSQGYESKYNKKFCSDLNQRGVKLLSLHDADGNGIEMDLILQHHSMAGAHLPDDLIVRPYRMGFFPTIGDKVGSPPTPMEATHIKSLDDIKERLELIDDPIYLEEIELLKTQKQRWELQSMSALDMSAGMAYVIEYLRNREIPVKRYPNLVEMRNQIISNYTRSEMYDTLKISLENVVKKFIKEQVTDKIITQILESLDDDCRQVIEDVDDYPDIPDNETLYDVWANRIAKSITSTTKQISDKVISDFCKAKVNTAIKDETQALAAITNDGKKITIDIEQIRNQLELSAERKFADYQQVGLPNLYDSVIKTCKIKKDVAVKFRDALDEKLSNIPIIEEEFVIPEQEEIDDNFDNLPEKETEEN